MSYPPSGPPRPYSGGQFPPGPYPPTSQPTPPTSQPFPPTSQPYPPGAPVVAAPRKKRGWGIALVLLGVAGLLAVLCCGGVGGLFWYLPKQERDANMRVFESLGVPEGFTVNEPRFMGELTTVEATYYLVCEKKICPVNPAEKIHSWVTGNGMTNTTLQDVGKCLEDAADNRSSDLCILEWRVDGKVVSVHVMWTVVSGGGAEDWQWILDTEVRTPVD